MSHQIIYRPGADHEIGRVKESPHVLRRFNPPVEMCEDTYELAAPGWRDVAPKRSLLETRPLMRRLHDESGLIHERSPENFSQRAVQFARITG